MGFVLDAHLAHYELNGFVVVEGLLDVVEDIQPVMDEYAQVLDRLAHQLYKDGQIASLYTELPFGERLTQVYAESGVVHSQYFDKGGHGFTLRTPESVATWPETCETWLKQQKILPQ